MESVVQGFQVGGVDYIIRPFREEEVLIRIETHLKIRTCPERSEGSAVSSFRRQL
jgi:DNA-binding response OmpR family regulator